MLISIDEKSIDVTDQNLNIVQIAKTNGIIIPSPCFNTNRIHGCCNACIIEIEGSIHYACCTKPTDGMKIIFKRDDLNALRREKIKEYSFNKKNNIKSACCGSEDISESSCDCGCDSGCC